MTTILHVDSSDFYRKVLHNKFADNGFTYLEAKDIDDAYNILETEAIDVIFTAVEFAYQDSSMFIKRLNNSKHRHIPVFVITSTQSQEKREELFALGIIDYINKSTSPDDILKYVKYYTSHDNLIEKIRKLRIAVVDDSSMVLSMIKKIFELHRITNVDYYKDALDLDYTLAFYDIFLVDYILEESTGEKIVRNIRKNKQNAVIIVVSSVHNSKTIANMLSIGADDYIVKPFDLDVFMARIKTNARLYFLVKELEEKNKELNELKQQSADNSANP